MTDSLDFSAVQIGTTLPSDERAPGQLELFLFVSAIGMAHRIHYDQDFTVKVEGHRGLLVPGPLQTTYLTQLVQRWAGHGVVLKRLAYRHLAPAFVNEPIRCFASVTSVDRTTKELACKIWSENIAGEVLTRGELVLRWA